MDPFVECWPEAKKEKRTAVTFKICKEQISHSGSLSYDLQALQSCTKYQIENVL